MQSLGLTRAFNSWSPLCIRLTTMIENHCQIFWVPSHMAGYGWPTIIFLIQCPKSFRKAFKVLTIFYIKCSRHGGFDEILLSTWHSALGLMKCLQKKYVALPSIFVYQTSKLYTRRCLYFFTSLDQTIL